jgi:putative membrane protein
MLEPLLVTIHVVANLIWIGSIASVGILLATSTPENAQSFGAAARRIYSSISTPAFGVSFLFGVARLSLSPATYMHLHWFHAKLTFALAVIALHHVIGAKAKRAANNDAPRSMHSGKSSAILTSALLACASLAVAFVIFQSQLVP